VSLGLPNSSKIAEKSGIASDAYQGWFQKVDNALILTGVMTPGNMIISDGGNSGSDGGPVPVGGITQLTGPVTAGPGSGSQASTITPTGVVAGSYTDASITVNAAGQVTAASSGSSITAGSALTLMLMGG